LATDGNELGVYQTLEESGQRVAAAKQLSVAAQKIVHLFGPDFETECGIKVRGTRIRDFFATRAQCEICDPEGTQLRIRLLHGEAVSILLRFDENVGAVIPAIAGFVAGLTFEDGELVDVAYEPSVNSWRWNEFRTKAPNLRTLRALAAAASHNSLFRIAAQDAGACSMQLAKDVDPTLAIYAAYAFHDIQATDLLEEMFRYQTEDLGVTFFDLALLNRLSVEKPTNFEARLVPFVPLLSQGWAVLNANRVNLHPALLGIEKNMLNSLWSLFDMHGLQKLKRAMATMEVR
jgi:hypothetical protein